jgi:MoaA/NifB/PqqE/SkfB family radical SAM enzyme
MVTRRCNYRCAGCNVWREQDNEELSTEEIKRGLDVLRKLGVVEVLISGGNPLLRADIDEIIEYASRYFFTTVYDNGSMAAEKIDALRHANFVAISIDSLNPEKNDRIRGVKGAWKRAMETVEKLHREGINVSVTPTISQANLYEIVDFTKYFLNKGIPVWYSLYSYDATECSNSLFKIGKEEDVFLIKDRDAMVKVCDALLEMKRKDDNVLVTTKVLEAVKHLYLDNKRIWRCRALQNFFVINHRGEVAGCHLHEPVASIFELPNLWKSEKFEALRKKYSECERCTYLCYIFYSIHGSVAGNVDMVRDKWRSVRFFLKRR